MIPILFWVYINKFMFVRQLTPRIVYKHLYYTPLYCWKQICNNVHLHISLRIRKKNNILVIKFFGIHFSVENKGRPVLLFIFTISGDLRTVGTVGSQPDEDLYLLVSLLNSPTCRIFNGIFFNSDKITTIYYSGLFQVKILVEILGPKVDPIKSIGIDQK